MIQAVQYLNTLSPRVRQVIYAVFIVAFVAVYGASAAFGTDPNWLSTAHRVLEALAPFALGLAVTHVNASNADTKVEVPSTSATRGQADDAEEVDEIDAPAPAEVD